MTNAAKVDASDDQTTIRQRLLLNPVLLDFSNITFDSIFEYASHTNKLNRS